MYSESKQILIPTMSNPDLFLIKENPEDNINSFVNSQKNLKLKSNDKRHENVSEEAESSKRVASNESRQEEASSSLLGQKVREEDDGFRTPTRLVNRIPAAKQCPPPPRKPKPSLKRKTSSHSFSCTHPLDFSKEVELLLSPGHQNHRNSLSDSGVTTKKIRTEKNTQ